MLAARKTQEQLTKNLLSPIILDLLENQPMCGYEIMTTIKKTFGVTFGPSTIYPTLNRLESESLIESEWNLDTHHPKKVYKLTRKGLEILHYSIGSLNHICRSFENSNQRFEKKMQFGIIIE